MAVSDEDLEFILGDPFNLLVLMLSAPPTLPQGPRIPQASIQVFDDKINVEIPRTREEDHFSTVYFPKPAIHFACLLLESWRRGFPLESPKSQQDASEAHNIGIDTERRIMSAALFYTHHNKVSVGNRYPLAYNFSGPGLMDPRESDTTHEFLRRLRLLPTPTEQGDKPPLKVGQITESEKEQRPDPTELLVNIDNRTHDALRNLESRGYILDPYTLEAIGAIILYVGVPLDWARRTEHGEGVYAEIDHLYIKTPFIEINMETTRVSRRKISRVFHYHIRGASFIRRVLKTMAAEYLSQESSAQNRRDDSLPTPKIPPQITLNGERPNDENKP